MNVAQRAKANVLAEPDRNRKSIFQVVLGTVIIGTVVAGLIGLSTGFIFLGVAFVFMGGAELVPADRRQVAGILRICSTAAFVLFGLFYLLPMVL